MRATPSPAAASLLGGADTAGEATGALSTPFLNSLLITCTDSCVHEKRDEEGGVAERLDVPSLGPPCRSPNPGPATYYMCNCDPIT